MTGYQEILTDPSYFGQGVLFTVSHIGNVGINLEDDESAKPQVSAAVIRSLSPLVSNWRSVLSLSDWLKQNGVPGISGVDTCWLTRKLRDGGTQKAALSTKGTSTEELLKMAREWEGLIGREMVKEAVLPFKKLLLLFPLHAENCCPRRNCHDGNTTNSGYGFTGSIANCLAA